MIFKVKKQSILTVFMFSTYDVENYVENVENSSKTT